MIIIESQFAHHGGDNGIIIRSKSCCGEMARYKSKYDGYDHEGHDNA